VAVADRARVTTPLGHSIARLVAAEGPLTLDRYMALCLGHPEHGYYMTRDPFGAAGDFVTAPEVTQIFGELVGIWCVGVHEAMGSPAAFNLVELGPGRGTLMSDLLRAARVAPAFLDAAHVHLVETSPILRRAQQKTLAGFAPRIDWLERLDDLPDAPFILVANEFFDALPVRQFERAGRGWSERVVGLDGDVLTLGRVPFLGDLPGWTAAAAPGDVAEVSAASQAVAAAVGERLAHLPGATLVIDYGHGRSSLGDTLQAVRAHRPVSILDAPGDCDLTAHVDFETLGRTMATAGATVLSPLTQREFLLRMGLEARLRTLSAAADAEGRRDLELAAERVAGPAQMGHLFKVLAATSAGLPVQYPFEGRFAHD
jgi:SAM-dependent MidA family methyltransferase